MVENLFYGNKINKYGATNKVASLSRLLPPPYNEQHDIPPGSAMHEMTSALRKAEF